MDKLKSIKTSGLLVIIIITSLVYSNHFNNPFFFDDSHTIENNTAITSLNNWNSFFTDAKTFSSLPANRAYRPMITLMNAIDYKMAGGLDSKYYHYHIFFWYLIAIVLFFFLTHYLFKKSFENDGNQLSILIGALITTLFFAVHTINAETINYICARSDSFSTLCIIASLLLFINKSTRKFHLYLLTMIVGILTKQTAVMFVPILFIYVILFEEKVKIKDFTNWSIRMIKIMVIPALVGGGLFLFNQLYLTPKSTVSVNLTVTKFEYISTQFFVMLHYLGNFILPTTLSADPDISIITPWYDKRILLGFFVVVGLIWVAIKSLRQTKTLPIAFGIAWFFIGLLPTTLVPLFQIANDHRMFFPFIGIFIALGCGGYLFVINKQNWVKISTLSLVGLLIVGYSYGTYQRNKVWNDAETLWKDVTIKSPKNGRGLMNYGLSQMNKGNYNEAEHYFLEAQKIQPNYYILEINMGVLYGAPGSLKNDEKAERHYLKAISLNSNAPSPDYYYAKFLIKKDKSVLAKDHLNNALLISPNHQQSIDLLESLKEMPLTQNVDDLINYGLHHMQIGYFNYAEYYFLEALKINPSYHITEINLGILYGAMNNHDKAETHFNKASLLSPNTAEVDFYYGRYLHQIGKTKSAIKQLKTALQKNPNHITSQQLLKDISPNAFQLNNDKYSNITNNKVDENKLKEAETLHAQAFDLLQKKQYAKSIDLFNKVLVINPNNAAALNDMGFAFMKLKNFKNAVKCFEKAIDIDSNYQLAKNNLNWALNELNK
ncbi:MAG: hypothetical protein CL846_03580 [Crocinitomicaceae bacterium]|nr:hypothetical protein [Crocinitomicaceae bacterium]